MSDKEKPQPSSPPPDQAPSSSPSEEQAPPTEPEPAYEPQWIQEAEPHDGIEKAIVDHTPERKEEPS